MSKGFSPKYNLGQSIMGIVIFGNLIIGPFALDSQDLQASI
jgi:hypothetical protein